jgi:hypothetical protein
MIMKVTGEICRFNLLKTARHTYRSTMNIKCVSPSQQVMFKTLLAPKNILHIMLKMWAETHVGLEVKWLLHKTVQCKQKLKRQSSCKINQDQIS